MGSNNRCSDQKLQLPRLSPTRQSCTLHNEEMNDKTRADLSDKRVVHRIVVCTMSSTDIITRWLMCLSANVLHPVPRVCCLHCIYINSHTATLHHWWHAHWYTTQQDQTLQTQRLTWSVHKQLSRLLPRNSSISGILYEVRILYQLGKYNLHVLRSFNQIVSTNVKSSCFVSQYCLLSLHCGMLAVMLLVALSQWNHTCQAWIYAPRAPAHQGAPNDGHDFFSV